MSKEEVAERAKEYIENAPENTQKIQVIFLGDGGWIGTQSWWVEEEEEVVK